MGFAVVLSVLGAFTARADISAVTLIYITLANFLAVTFTFMINDVEDSEDDAKDPAKVTRNPVSAGLMTKTTGYVVSYITAALSLAIYALVGGYSFCVGFSIVFVGFLYSWKKLRLKGIPILDVLSHSYFLGGALLLSGFFAATQPTFKVLIPFVLVSLVSVAGDLRNGVRDFVVDREVDLKNTAGLLGIAKSKRIINLITALSLIGIGIFYLGFWKEFNILAFVGAGVLIFGLFSVVLTKKEKVTFNFINQALFVISIGLALSIYY